MRINNLQTKLSPLVGKEAELRALRIDLYYEKDPVKKAELRIKVEALHAELYGEEEV